MNKMEWLKQVEKLKNQPAFLSYVYNMSLKEIATICKAWAMSNVHYSEDVKNDSKNPWVYSEFNYEIFKELANIKRRDAFSSLVMANILYPDGTFNDSFLNLKKEEKNGNAKSRKRTKN